MSQVIFLVSKNAPLNELNALPSENIKSNISDGSSPSSPVGVEHACKLCRVHFYSDAEKPEMHISRVFTHTACKRVRVTFRGRHLSGWCRTSTCAQTRFTPKMSRRSTSRQIERKKSIAGINNSFAVSENR